MKHLILIVGLICAAQATASGDYGPSYMHYKAYTAPDIASERFQAGQLGVLQPGMQPVYLYTAWRAITLGATVKAEPGLRGGLARADGSVFATGAQRDTATASNEQWLRESGRTASSFGACPAESNRLALTTLNTIHQRSDGVAARVTAWVDAQEQVSMACKAAEDGRYRGEGTALAIVVPPPLPDSEPAYWRGLRDYQRAAILFHAERYAEATALFNQIGASESHPMRHLGRYLALRSLVRLAVKQADKATDTQRQAACAALEASGRAILADRSLASLHEATRATLRSARVQLIPQAVVADLSERLADAATDPFVDDHLGDWVVAMRRAGERPQLRADGIPALRSQYEFIDWIENLGSCGYAPVADRLCRIPAQHALERWQRTGSRPWLVALMMTSETLPAAAEAAALSVSITDPAYLTARYHLARLYRLAGRTDAARAISDAALTLDLSDGTRNLFREERFAVATSVPDAAQYMLRVDVDRWRGDAVRRQSFNEDALRWLADGVSAADMIVLARASALDAVTRSRLASGAWMRADLLAKPALALEALAVLEPLASVLKDDIANYRNARSPAERRHLMLLTALSFRLSPNMAENSWPIEAVEKDDVAASNWCAFKADTATNASTPFPWRLPAMPATGERELAASELSKLSALKTSTGFIGDHILKRARLQPADPDLPWLLHVVVASTRGGCRDQDASLMSREAFNLLHKRFPDNEWTRKTRFYY